MGELTLSKGALYPLLTSFFAQSAPCRMKIQCKGESMAPFIRNNSILTLKAFPLLGRPKFGEIVVTAVHARQQILIHRVVACRPPRYLIKGDNTPACDGWFHRKDILAAVETVETGKHRHTSLGWQNTLIALASRTGLLNHLLLPLARCIRKNLQ